MNFFADNILIILILPLITACLSLFAYIYKFSVSNKTLNWFTVLSTFAGVIFSVSIFQYLITNDIQDIEQAVNWIKIGNYNFSAGIYADKLSVLFLSALLIVSLAVQYYSVKYVPRDTKYPLYLSYINFFNVITGGLLLSSNIPQTYIFWELIGVMSYLLINFNFEKFKKSNASKNALILNKIGDTLFLTGIIILVYFLITYPIYDGDKLLAYSDFSEIASDFYVYLSDTWFYIACMLLFFGIIAKSAQFPLHVWIKDSTEASVPACILISTSTIAGVYLGIRLLPLFELSVSVMNTILYIGLLTALFCGFFAIAQNNIKRMLAYSTSSQLGLVIASIGLNIPFAALLYFLTHIFSKAVLFLCAGNMYKISGESSFNISDFKCSRKQYPLLAYSYFIAIVALCGLFFAGATAKDMMVNAYSASMQISAITIFVIVLFITSYYLFRSYFMIFERKSDSDLIGVYDFRLNLPVILLTIFVVAVTFFPQNIIEFYNKYSEVQQELLSSGLKYILSFTAILSGLILGWFAGIKGKEPLPKFLKNLSVKGFYISRIYNGFAENIFELFANLTKNVDKYIINGIFNLFAKLTNLFAWIVSVFQNGNVQSYVTYGILFISLIIGAIGVFLFLLRGIVQ